MDKEKIFYIPVGTKKYPLVVRETGKIDPEDGEVVHITCNILHLDQKYLKSDLPFLFMDIGGMIEEELAQKTTSHISDFVKEKIFI